jgi:hypothetical protein
MLKPPSTEPQPGQPAPASSSVALRTVAEARRILEEVVTSSESFNYPKAKSGLKELQRLIRVLGREEARLRAHPSQILPTLPTLPGDSAKVVPFPVDS